MLRRPFFFTVLLSLLLVALGFMLGQFHVVSGGSFWPSSESLLRVRSFFSAADDGTGAKEKEEMPGECLLESGNGELYPSIEVPGEVGGLALDLIISGEEAVALASQIYGDVDCVESVLIPSYSNGEERVTIWIFSMLSPAEAEVYLEKINRRVLSSERFTVCDSFFIQETQIHHVQGLDMINYYYASGSNVFWHSLVSDDPLPLFLEFYEGL